WVHVSFRPTTSMGLDDIELAIAANLYGSPQVDGDEDVDDVDDLANEFSLGTAWNVANVTKGSTVVIFGLETVGLSISAGINSVAQGEKLRGASRIIGVDKNPQKCEKGAKISPEIDLNIVFSPSTILGSLFVIVFVVAVAKAFGFIEVVDPSSYQEPIAQVIKRTTDGGADFSFECVGDTDMITTALHSCCDVILIVAKTLLQCVEVKPGDCVKIDELEVANAYIHIFQVALGEASKNEKSKEPVVVYLKVGVQQLVLGTLNREEIPKYPWIWFSTKRLSFPTLARVAVSISVDIGLIDILYTTSIC
ncbi:hypothetical protein S83_012068, partial [Arachis hypogaea]